MVPKKQSSTRKNQGIFASSSTKKFIPDQQSSKLILNYFEFNNFQDFNTWQQIAKTKTEYKFVEVSNNKFECELSFKWQSGENETMNFKASAASKKNAKKKTLILLIQALMFKGLIGQGFKQKRFVQKLPRRKKYDQSSSQEDNNNQVHHTKRANIINAIKEKRFEQILENTCAENVNIIKLQAPEVWSYALSTKSLELCDRVLKKIFSRGENSINEEVKIREFDCTGKKQVSYVEQFKDPFQEDLTVFIRYYQLQRPQFEKSNFNLQPKNPQKCTEMILPSLMLSSDTIQSGLKPDSFRDFKTIEQISQEIGKRRKKVQKKVKIGFFDELQNISLPKFEQETQEKQFFPFKIIEKMFNEILFVSQDYQFAINALELLADQIQGVNFLDVSQQVQEKSQQKIPISQSENINQKAEQYYRNMKRNLLTEMIYNLNAKQKPQKLSRNLSIQGMINFASSHSKYEGIFQFTSKESQDLMLKKIQKKNNFNQFFQQNQFCNEEMVLLVNKLTQKVCIGIICQLSQSFKIYVPHLLFESQYDFPAPFTIYKLLNNKIYSKLSSSLIHICKHNIQLVNYEIQKNKNVFLILESPSGPHLQIIEEILAESVGQKMFILIVSENYEVLHKVLTDKGFKCLKASMNTDEKVVSKNNIILANQLNVCMDSMKNIAFDRVIIEEAQRVPEIISLLSIIKCTKKLYLIGNSNLPRSEMKSPLSKKNSIQKSLFEKYIQTHCDYIIFASSKLNLADDSTKKTQQKVFDSSIVQWLKISVYENQILTELEDTTIKKTPSIKGFNWPSNDYRLCFINSENKTQKYEEWINSQCELIVWIIAQVLKSGFTELQQISCCCIDSQLIPILQQHLLKILIKLNIQPLQWSIVFQSLIKPLNGSIWSSNNLILVLATDKNSENASNLDQHNSQNDAQMGKKLNSALLQAQRGLIIVGNVNDLSKKSTAWSNFIDWMASKKLILSYDLPI